MPISQLTKFSVVRLVHPVAALPFPPPTVVVPKQLASHRLTPLPPDLLAAIKTDGSRLTSLALDWWEMTTSDLEDILVACPRLRKLQIAIKASVVEVVHMSTAFANVPDLVELNITSDPIFATAALKAVKVKKTRKDKAGAEGGDHLPAFLADRVAEADGDPTLVDPRDLRKFLRRLPAFRVLRWMGRGGKGEWRIGGSKKSTLTHIDFIHAGALHKRVWIESQLAAPSFEFEEDDDVANPLSLELPASPDRQTPTELPTLSRATTGSTTSLMTAATPPPAAPGMGARRASATAAAGGGSGGGGAVLGLEWETLPSPTSTAGAAAASVGVAAPSLGTRKSSGSTSPRRRASEGGAGEKGLEFRTTNGYKGRKGSNDKGGSGVSGSKRNGFPSAKSQTSPRERERLVPGSDGARREKATGERDKGECGEKEKSERGGERERRASSPTKRPPKTSTGGDGWTTVGVAK